MEKEYLDALNKYFIEMLPSIFKEPGNNIRHRFLDPGATYDGNVWDWDTYWSDMSVLSLTKNAEKEQRENIFEYLKGNVLNFLDHQSEDGYIPMMVDRNSSNESLTDYHEKGIMMNMHKPFLCQQIRIISENCNDYTWITGFLTKLESYFHYYYETYYFEKSGLFVWCDDIMIGMDNDPASFGRPKWSTANIFLNSFMVAELWAAQTIYQNLNYKQEVKLYSKRAEQLIKAIRMECFDGRDKFFYSVDVDIKTREFEWFHKGLGVFWNTLPIKIRVWSGFIPMWAGFATKEEAAYLVEHYRDEGTFNSPFGVYTLARDEKMFNISASGNPSNWLGPIWTIANYVVFHGLLNYGYRKEAEELYHKTLALLGEDLKKTGTLHEYYNPFTGVPVMNGQFLDWNMLIINMRDELDGIFLYQTRVN
jgi:putative isomerase